MHLAVIPALCTFCLSVAMALQLAARRYKEPLHWMLIAFLCSLAVWNVGSIARFSATTDEALHVTVKLVVIGSLMCASFWLLAAALYERGRSAPRPGLPVFVLGCSSLLALALLTNDGHRLFLRQLDAISVEAGPRAFAGPIFWVFVAWVYFCVGLGIAFYLRASRRMLRNDSRRRGMLLALASVVPLATSTIYVFQLVPVSFDLTPGGLMLAMALLWVAVLRYRLFESLPLARQAVVSQLDEGVVMATASGRITDWNAAAARILGAPPLRPGEPLGEALERLQTAPDERVVEVTMAVVEEGRDEPSGQFAILSDRTDIDRIERLARQTQRLEIVGALAADFAHEINDPLAFVRSNLIEIERLGQRVEGARAEAEPGGADAALVAELADLRAVALETLEGVERMRRTVEGMRGLARGDLEHLEPIDLAQVVRDAVRLARLDARDGSGPALRLLLAPTPAVRGNADSLVRVVLNLLVNARQALGDAPDARIRVELRRSGDQVELSVRDNGPGIAPGLRHRIFDPFFTTRDPDRGTGLGLAIAFDIAREHGGVLEEHSAPGGGACFTLRLPLEGADGADRSASAG